jgi:3'(2'), 5'-bisphosphate nucleotidase
VRIPSKAYLRTLARAMSDSGAALAHVESVVRLAGAAVLRHYGLACAPVDPGPSPVTAADRASNRILLAGLRSAFPADAILSEEEKDSGDRLERERVWIVDPLDGTKEFLAGNGEFSVMVGLVERGEPVLGLVYLPALDVLYGAVRGRGAWVERGGRRSRLRCAPADPRGLRLVGSRSHPDPLLARMQGALGIPEAVPCGSVGVKCGRIAESECDLYLHPVPYLKEWDTCAPDAILTEAGGWVSDCRGEPLRYNKPDPVQPHGILAAAPGCAWHVLARTRALYAQARPVGSAT